MILVTTIIDIISISYCEETLLHPQCEDEIEFVAQNCHGGGCVSRTAEILEAIETGSR